MRAPEERTKNFESVLTVFGGNIVYAAAPLQDGPRHPCHW
jgi:hypothetical protein